MKCTDGLTTLNRKGPGRPYEGLVVSYGLLG